MARLSNAELRATIVKGQKGLETLTDEDIGLYGPYATNVIRNYFVGFEHMRSGLLPESQWRTFQAALGPSLRRSRGNREHWTLRRDEYPREFQDMVDALVTEAEEADPNKFE